MVNRSAKAQSVAHHQLYHHQRVSSSSNSHRSVVIKKNSAKSVCDSVVFVHRFGAILVYTPEYLPSYLPYLRFVDLVCWWINSIENSQWKSGAGEREFI